MQSKTPSSVMSWLGRAALLLTSLSLATSLAHAGQVSTPDLSAAYGASNFGSKPVSIRWLTPVSIVNASLTTIDLRDELLGLALLSPDLSPVINAFFVDKITFCDGESASNFKGCSFLNSNVFAVESSFTAGASGALNIAHELGHTMGLEHVSGVNLMNPFLGSAVLTAVQVNTVLGNSRVRTAADGGRYIEIRPVAVLAAAPIPEPETYALMLAGLMLVGAAARRAARGSVSPR